MSWDTFLAPHADCIVPDYSAESSLAAMAERAMAEAPPSFAVAGHSMGGRVALEVLRAAPGRVGRLALLDTGYRSRPDGPPGYIFDPDCDLVWDRKTPLPGHPNGMVFQALPVAMLSIRLTHTSISRAAATDSTGLQRFSWGIPPAHI